MEERDDDMVGKKPKIRIERKKKKRMEGRQEKPVDSKLLFTKLIYSNGYEVILFAQFNPNLSVSKDEATKRGLPVYQQLHAKTFTLIGGLVLQSWRQGAFGRVGWLVGCLLACLPAGIFCWARFPDTPGPLGRGTACFGSRSLSRPSSCSPPKF